MKKKFGYLKVAFGVLKNFFAINGFVKIEAGYANGKIKLTRYYLIGITNHA